MNPFAEHPVSTNRKTRFSWSRSKVGILKLDHNYFQEDSAVLMPVKLFSDKSNKDASDAAALMEGIKSLAAIIKLCEVDNRNRIIIAGFADSSDSTGGIREHFTLSELRAKNVLFLLTGNRTEWAKISAGCHQVKDYQRLLKYFSNRQYGKDSPVKFNCDPGRVDGNYGTHSEDALREFLTAYNDNLNPDRELKGLIDPAAAKLPISDVMRAVKNEAKHECTNEGVWAAFYDLLTLDLCRVIGGAGMTLAQLKAKRAVLKFADDRKNYVACGESFPLKNLGDEQNSQYDPKPIRGIEILFFQADEIPGKKDLGVLRLNCQPSTTAAHTAELCPIFYKHHMLVSYVDYRCLVLVIYHFKFWYFDRILNQMKEVPEGLKIEAYHYEVPGGAKKPINCVTEFNKGVYTVKVLEDNNRKNIYFSFKGVDSADASKSLWVFTQKKGATPKIMPAKRVNVNKLALTTRLKFYDLPAEWSSENYWTRYDNDMNKGKRYIDVMMDKGLKPFGANISVAGQPLMFSLEDIVLVDKDGHQNINSADDKAKDRKHDDVAIPLSDKSRLTLFYLDQKDEYKLKIYKGRGTHPYFSDIEFKQNLITLTPEKDKINRLITFCSGFYSITDSRTARTAKFKRAAGHILGARAAVHNDSNVHGFADNIHPDLASGVPTADMKDYVQKWVGNYELHYLHNCGMTKSCIDGKYKPLSYLIVYWNCRLRRHPDNAKMPNVANWRQNWEKEGVINSMNRTNRPYLLEKATGTKDILIRLYHFYEAKLDGVGGKHKCDVQVTKEDSDWMLPEEAEFCQNSYKDQPNYYVALGPDGNHPDVDGRTFAPLMNHHEMGHATGCLDDYLYDLEWNNNTFSGLPRFAQHATARGGPYSADTIATMFNCRNPRMRDFWHFVNWVNDESDNSNNSKLEPFLKSTKFLMTYKYKDTAGASKVIKLDLRNAAYRDSSKPAHSKDNFQFNTAATHKGKADLLLYKLAGGETAQTVDPKKLLDPVHVMNPRVEFDAILVINIKLAPQFINDNQNWTVATAESWMTEFLLKPFQGLNKFYLKSTANNPFKKTLLYFVPYFAIVVPPGTPAPADAHFKLEVKYYYHPPNDPPNAHRRNFSVVGGIVKVDNDVDTNKLLSHFLGKSPAGAIVKDDLKRVKKWLALKAGVAENTFTIEEFA